MKYLIIINVSGEIFSVPVSIPDPQQLAWHRVASALDLIRGRLNYGDHVSQERRFIVPSNIMTLYKQSSLPTLYNQTVHLEIYNRQFLHLSLMNLFHFLGFYISELNHHIKNKLPFDGHIKIFIIITLNI